MNWLVGGPRKVTRYSLAANPDAHFTPYRTLESGKATLTRQGVAAFMPAVTPSKRGWDC